MKRNKGKGSKFIVELPMDKLRGVASKHITTPDFSPVSQLARHKEP